MKCHVNFFLEVESPQFYKNLLAEEDFDFNNKDVGISILEKENGLEAKVEASSVLEMKIGVNALVKSIEVIDKTLRIEEE